MVIYMKISITDKFLWEIYNVMHEAGEILDFTLNPRAVKFMPGPNNPIFKKYRKEKGAKEFSKLIYYLKTRNYIKVKNLESKKGIMLTKEGINKALKASFIIEGKQKRKDGRWIMVIFDIPEKWRKSRNLLRSILRNLGYKLFQQSVWITPYDVSEKTDRAMQMYNLDEFVKIFLIEEL